MALRQALLHHPYGSHMTIYTDSLCSLHLLNRLIYEPKTTLESKHLALLQSLQVLLSQRICHGATKWAIRSASGFS